MWSKPKQNGFTIVELLIVIVIIGILAAITIVAYNGIQARATFVKMQTEVEQLNKAIQLYYVDNGAYPLSNVCGAADGGWCGWSQVTGDNFIPGLSPKYIAKTPQLPVGGVRGASYLYRSPDGVDYKLIRLLPSGLPDSEKTQPSLLDGWNVDRWGYWSSGARYW